MRQEGSFTKMGPYIWFGAFTKLLETTEGATNALSVNLLNKICLTIMNSSPWLQSFTSALNLAK